MNILQNRIALHTWTIDTTPLADADKVALQAGMQLIYPTLAALQAAYPASAALAGVQLLVGSAGRLGVMAELTFKVFPRPAAWRLAS